jgi:hypothetical protein
MYDDGGGVDSFNVRPKLAGLAEVLGSPPD